MKTVTAIVAQNSVPTIMLILGSLRLDPFDGGPLVTLRQIRCRRDICKLAIVLTIGTRHIL
jgi:hypothetical protein